MTEHQHDLKFVTPDTAVLASALTGFAWAAILLIPGDSLSRSHLAYLSIIGGDNTWAMGLTALSSGQLWCFYERRREIRPKWSSILGFIVSFSSAMTWTFVSCLCALSSFPPNPSIGSTVIIAGGVWWDFMSFDHETTRAKLTEIEAEESWQVPLRRRAGDRRHGS